MHVCSVSGLDLPQHTDGGQKTTPGSQLSLSTVGCQACQRAPLPLSDLISPPDFLCSVSLSSYPQFIVLPL